MRNDIVIQKIKTESGLTFAYSLIYNVRFNISLFPTNRQEGETMG